MDFGDEADERAKKAEIRVHELEEELGRVVDERAKECERLEIQCKIQLVDSSGEGSAMEQLLLKSLITTMVGNDEVTSTAHAFLQANSGVEVCQKLLNTWNSLRPSTQRILVLAAEVETLENDKVFLRCNLTRAEEEVSSTWLLIYSINGTLPIDKLFSSMRLREIVEAPERKVLPPWF